VYDFTPMQRVIPPGQSGHYRVEHFEVTEKKSEFTRYRAAIKGDLDLYVPAGKYVRLVCGNGIFQEVVMSDTPMEKRSNRAVVSNAHGDMLIIGIGLGMILIPILAKRDVRSVTVLEKHREVIDLVEPHLRKYLGEKDSNKLQIIHADGFEWRPPKAKTRGYYNVIYFDIWNAICTDNLQEITKLKRRYCRRLLRRKDQTAWMGAWYEDNLRYKARRGRC